jgi:NAD(P)H dehydrogenase (quinone)
VHYVSVMLSCDTGARRAHPTNPCRVMISIILAHPDPRSFNHAVARTCAEQLSTNGHESVFHDLYEEGFDAVLRAHEIPEDATVSPQVADHCAQIVDADGIVVVHPNWWGQPPAVLTGWIDRVIRPGIAYEFLDGDAGEGVPSGLLRARAAVVFNTSNTNPVRELAAFGDPLETIWKNCVFGLCGVEEFTRRTFSPIVTSTQSEREQWLLEVRDVINAVFPEAVTSKPAVGPAGEKQKE